MMESIDIEREETLVESQHKGLEELIELFYNINWGNCTVWYISSMDDYAVFVNSFLHRCQDQKNRVIYVKTEGNLEEKLCSRNFLNVYNFKYIEDFQHSVESIKGFIKSNEPHISYIFDDISCLKERWGETELFHFFQTVNSHLQEFGAVSYWPLLRGSLIQDTVVKFSGVAQFLISVTKLDEEVCIHPLKVPSEKLYHVIKPFFFDFKSLGLEKMDNSSILLDLIMQKVEVDQLEQKLKRSEERYQDLLDSAIRYKNIIGSSKHVHKVCRMIGIAAESDSTVLILGESGTGKELVAETIHFHSSRSKEPFVKVNCAAISETLLESELFGHKRGAFTGAIHDRKGRFHIANNGTILLDEIGCMSLTGQAKLLRVLQEKEIEPVGESMSIKVDVRIIATTNLDLEKAIKEGRFREDLYYRLNVFAIHLVSLRERMDDVPALAEYFLMKYSREMKKTIKKISPIVFSILQAYDWPGNVRELKNAIEYAVMMEKEKTLQSFNLPQRILDVSRGKTPIELFNLRKKLEITEKETILRVLDRTQWIKKKTSKILGINPKNLSYFLKKHHIKNRNIRP